MLIPKTSVIIPTWNRSNFLREAVLSAVSQTSPPLEIIVVDNGSDNGQKAAILHLAALHENVRLITLDRNYGPGYARNVGIEASKGDWVLFLDDDDLLFVDFLECCFSALESNNVAQVVIGRSLRFEDGRSVKYPRDLCTGLSLNQYRKNLVTAFLSLGVAIGSCLIRREAIGLHRFPTHIKFGEDTVFWLEVFRTTPAPAIAESAFVVIRQHEQQTTVIWRKLKANGFASKHSISPWLPRVLKGLEGAESWLISLAHLKAIKNCRSAWSELPQLIMRRPDIVLRSIPIWLKKRLAITGIWPLGGLPRLDSNSYLRKQSIRPSILFVCSVVPSPLGPGVSMRAYHQLVAIAQTYSVHLILCLPCSNNAEIPASLYGFCHDIEIMPRYKYSGLRGRIWQRWLRFRGDILAGELAYTDHIYKTRAWSRPTSFDRIHIHRLCLSPLVENLLRHFPLSFVSLDMDDLESNTRLSIGHLYKCAGERGRAYSLLREARQYRCLENYIIPKVNKIFVASETDKSILEKRFPNIQFATQLNVTRIPQKNSRQKAGPEAFLSFLFVGTLSYFPNVDALRYFASELAPALDSLGVKWRLRVVGALSQRLRMQLPRGDWRWTWVGWRENLESEYAISNVVIAPIRGGGGTRIKVLEAFAHQVPVVATSLAVEGLSIEHGVHCLVADTPPAFAQACANLKQNPALAEYLVIQAYEFVHSRFTPNILDTLLREERAC